ASRLRPISARIDSIAEATLRCSLACSCQRSIASAISTPSSTAMVCTSTSPRSIGSRRNHGAGDGSPGRAVSSFKGASGAGSASGPAQHDLAALAGLHQVEALLELIDRQLVGQDLAQREAAEDQL